jgi:hypothetical protein
LNSTVIDPKCLSFICERVLRLGMWEGQYDEKGLIKEKRPFYLDLEGDNTKKQMSQPMKNLPCLFVWFKRANTFSHVTWKVIYWLRWQTHFLIWLMRNSPCIFPWHEKANAISYVTNEKFLMHFLMWYEEANMTSNVTMMKRHCINVFDFINFN